MIAVDIGYGMIREFIESNQIQANHGSIVHNVGSDAVKKKRTIKCVNQYSRFRIQIIPHKKTNLIPIFEDVDWPKCLSGAGNAAGDFFVVRDCKRNLLGPTKDMNITATCIKQQVEGGLVYFLTAIPY